MYIMESRGEVLNYNEELIFNRSFFYRQETSFEVPKEICMFIVYFYKNVHVNPQLNTSLCFMNRYLLSIYIYARVHRSRNFFLLLEKGRFS